MKGQAVAIAGLLLASAGASPDCAAAAELFGGVYAHDVDTVFTKGGFEGGADAHIGWRGERLRALQSIGAPAPHIFASINSEGDTNYAAAGLNWKIGGRTFVRPGVGVAVHDRQSRLVRGGRRLDLGSRLLFELEMGLGYELSERVSIEASWVHLSHARLFSAQNPGIDNFGLRLNYRFR
jgi:hypothetical protein